MARPTKYNKELGERICKSIADGASLVSTLKQDGMPTQALIYSWLAEDKHEGFLEMYKRAREQQQENWAEQIIEISDKDGDVNRDRLRVDSRKWLVARLMPRKYGDRTLIEGDVTVHVKRIILEEASE